MAHTALDPNGKRGRRLDDVLPPVVDRTLRRPYVAPVSYIAHRCTLPHEMGMACDCGAPFETATELELHQAAARKARR